ncbi:hypothetical protein [Haloprofundus salilacus]|uniref:hypothetical protein n=1 Tax=Haloprofundus salilacus TaxID=2876190 RepID=UPI001CCFDCDA|nr:hypothetical protein [Haloprofundus salilacus]
MSTAVLQIDFGALFDPMMLLAALAGGAFGAALGALPAFIFTGFMVVYGQTAEYLNPDAADITGLIAFGPVFSPAISFAGGAAAAAYAADRGYMDFGFDYHEAKNIAAALGTRPDVLAVGAVFGVVGYWIQTLSGQLLLPWDGIAMGVVLSALLHRLAFGYDLIGKVRGDGVLDMSPFEREEMRVMGESAAGGDGSEAVTDGGTVTKQRFAVEPWLPQQYKWSGVAAIGLTAGTLGAFIWAVTGLPFLGFGISAASLLFLNCGVEKIPVTHHITLLGSAGAWAFVGSASPESAGVLAILVGALFGLISALFGELFQRVFYAHGDTHWDPPAAAIVFTTLLIAVLHIIGVLAGSAYMPTLGL